MNNDDLLEAVAELARQDPALGSQWRSLAEGTISDADRAALDALAERAASERESREAYRPLDEAARDRLADSLVADLAGTHEDSAPPSSQTRPLRVRREFPEVERTGVLSEEADSLGGTSGPPVLDDAALWGPDERDQDEEQSAAGRRSTLPPPPRWLRGTDTASGARSTEEPAVLDRFALVPVQPRALHDAGHPDRRATSAGWRSRARTYGAAAAWASGALLLSFLALRPAAFAPREPSMPVYAVAPGGAGAAEAEPSPVPEDPIAPGERLGIVLRPEARVSTPLAVRAYLTREGEVQPWKVEVRIDENGGLHVDGTREELFGNRPDGVWEAVFAVGRAEALPATPESLAAALREVPGEDAGYCLIRRRVVLSSPP